MKRNWARKRMSQFSSQKTACKTKMCKYTVFSPFTPWYIRWYPRIYCDFMNEKRSFWWKKIWFMTALDLIKCPKKMKLQRLLFSCTPISGLPSNKGTMLHPFCHDHYWKGGDHSSRNKRGGVIPGGARGGGVINNI